jgi:hypothetical protein
VKDIRRHRRIPHIGPVVISWSSAGETQYVRGKCLDISEGGLRLELTVGIPQMTDVFLKAEKVNVSGSARVRHTARYGSKYLIGVELSHELKASVVAALSA